MDAAQFLGFLNHGLALARQTRAYGDTLPEYGGGLEFTAGRPDRTKLSIYVEGTLFVISAADVQQLTHLS